jgi:polyisoprenoid-binding protein YceI/Flp pilus assembly protein TadD
MIVTTIAALMLSPLAAGAPAAAPARWQEYAIDAGHSIVEFSIPFAFGRVKGRFTNLHGTILYDPADPVNSSISVVIEAKSIDTGWPHRDEHLRTSDFFDVERYPTITFQSERLLASGGAWIAEGPLTMHGVTRQITIPFRLVRPPVRSPESRWMILNAVGSLRLARADFGIVGGSTYNSWFTKARSATMGDSVDVSLEVEGWSADAASQRSPGIDAALERVKTSGVQAQIARLTSAKDTTSAARWPQYFYGQDLLVRALVATNRLPDALPLARALIDLFPSSTNARVLYGYVLSASGDVRGADAQYALAKEAFKPPQPDPNERFKQDDENWWELDQLARTSIEWGRTREAVPLARVIAELYPSIARAHTTYGYALAMSGDSAAARAAYERALTADPGETRALELRRRLK